MREQLFKERARRRVRLKHRLALTDSLLVLRRRARAGQFDVVFISQLPQRFDEGDAVALHHEVDRVAAFLASEALEKLFHRIDVERRRLLRVKRAQSNVILASTLEAD